MQEQQVFKQCLIIVGAHNSRVKPSKVKIIDLVPRIADNLREVGWTILSRDSVILDINPLIRKKI